ncbi:MAG: TolC family outer membrane protein [Magnetococcales bacterium]|nr:TolC family outer membrane protein [Magnetococcales bacterium]
MDRKHNILRWLATVAGVMAVSTVQADTLIDAIHSALENNPEISIMQAGAGAAHLGVAEAKAGYYPSVSLRYTRSSEYSNTPSTRSSTGGSITLDPYEMSVTVNQMLWDGGLVSSRVAGASANSQAAHADLLNTAETIASQTAKLYLEVLKQKDLLKEAEEYLEVQNKILKLVQERVMHRVAPTSDVGEVESRKKTAEAAITTAKGDLEYAIASFEALVGDEVGEPQPSAITQIEFDSNPQTAMEFGLKNSPIIKSAKSRVESTRAVEKEKKAAFMPDIALNLKATNDLDLSGTPGTSRVQTGMIVVNYNIFAGFGDLKKKQSASLLRRQAEYTLDREIRTYKAQLKKNLSALKTAQKRKEIFTSQVIENEKVRDTFNEQFSVGRKTLFNLLDVEQSLFNSKNNMITEKYSVTLAGYNLLATQGLLLKTLGANTPKAEKPRYKLFF